MYPHNYPDYPSSASTTPRLINQVVCPYLFRPLFLPSLSLIVYRNTKDPLEKDAGPPLLGPFSATTGLHSPQIQVPLGRLIENMGPFWLSQEQGQRKFFLHRIERLY